MVNRATAGRWRGIRPAPSRSSPPCSPRPSRCRRNRSPDYPRLYSLRGFQYCGLLPGEPTAWRGPRHWRPLSRLRTDRRLNRACHPGGGRTASNANTQSREERAASPRIALDHSRWLGSGCSGRFWTFVFQPPSDPCRRRRLPPRRRRTGIYPPWSAHRACPLRPRRSRRRPGRLDEACGSPSGAR